MTTLAWDGTTLAADKGAFIGDINFSSLKLTRLTAILMCAQAGPTWLTTMLKRHLIGIDKVEPLYDKVDEGHLLLVRRHGPGLRTYIMNSSLVEEAITTPFIATGAGKEMAMGALAAGATAREAIEIVAKWGCGACWGVDEMRFE